MFFYPHLKVSKISLKKIIVLFCIGFFFSSKVHSFGSIYITILKCFKSKKMSVNPAQYRRYQKFYPQGTLPEEMGAFYTEKFNSLLHMIDYIYHTCPELSEYPQTKVMNLYELILSVYRANLKQDLENFHHPETYQETSKIIMKIVWHGQDPDIEVIKTFHSNPIENFSVNHQDIESVQFFVPADYLNAIHESIANINRELNAYRFHFWEAGQHGFRKFMQHSTETQREDWRREEGLEPIYDIPGFAQWDPNLTNPFTGRPGGGYKFEHKPSPIYQSFAGMHLH